MLLLNPQWLNAKATNTTVRGAVRVARMATVMLYESLPSTISLGRQRGTIGSVCGQMSLPRCSRDRSPWPLRARFNSNCGTADYDRHLEFAYYLHTQMGICLPMNIRSAPRQYRLCLFT